MKQYLINGVVRADFPIDVIDCRIKALSVKHAYFKLVRLIKQDGRVKIEDKILYNFIKKSKLSVVEEQIAPKVSVQNEDEFESLKRIDELGSDSSTSSEN